MTTLAGKGLLFGGCVALGLLTGLGRLRRVACLEEFRRSLSSLARELTFSLRPLPELAEDVAGTGPAGECLRACRRCFLASGGESWADLPADCVVSMNLWGFTPGYVDEAKAGFVAFLKENLPVNPLKCEYYLPSVVTAALQRGDADVHVLTSPDKWHGITYREDKPELVEALKKMSEDGLYPVDRLF